MRSNTFDLNERTPECYDQSAQKVLIVVACMIVLYVISIRIYPQTGYFFFPEISVLIAFSSPRWKFVELWNCCAFSNIFTMRSELLKLYQSINNNNDPKLQSILLFNKCYHQREETLIYICKNARNVYFFLPNRKLNSKIRAKRIKEFLVRNL